MKKTYTYYLELAARWHVFILLNLYGLGKLIGGQFYRKGELPAEVAAQTLGNVNSFDLAWTFMGHSYAYILFIGISQIIGAWCLLWNKTKLIGVAILLPILSNIVVFDIIFLDTYGALASACIYLSLLLLILFLNKEKVIRIFQTATQSSLTLPRLSLKTIGIVAALVVSIFAFEQTLVTIIGH